MIDFGKLQVNIIKNIFCKIYFINLTINYWME